MCETDFDEALMNTEEIIKRMAVCVRSLNQTKKLRYTFNFRSPILKLGKFASSFSLRRADGFEINLIKGFALLVAGVSPHSPAVVFYNYWYCTHQNVCKRRFPI